MSDGVVSATAKGMGSAARRHGQAARSVPRRAGNARCWLRGIAAALYLPLGVTAAVAAPVASPAAATPAASLQAPATAGSPRVWVLPFVDAGDPAQDSEHGAYLGALMEVSLSHTTRLSVIDRGYLREVLAEHDLTLRLPVAAGEGLEIGRMLAATVLISGGYRHVGEVLVVSAHAHDVASGRLLGSATASGDPAEPAGVMTRIHNSLLDDLDDTLPELRPDRLDPSPLANLHFLAGLGSYYAARYTQALAHFIDASHDARLAPLARLWMASCYLAEGRYEHAYLELRRLQLDPGVRPDQVDWRLEQCRDHLSEADRRRLDRLIGPGDSPVIAPGELAATAPAPTAPALSTPQEASPAPDTVAVLAFAGDGDRLGEMGREMAALVSASLSTNPRFMLVERDELDAALAEIELGLSGTVSPASAARIGFLTGAKILVSGRILAQRNELIVVAKIIGTETTRMVAETVTFDAEASDAAAARQLAEQIAATIETRAGELLAAETPGGDPIQELRALVAGKDLPTVSIEIDEAHVGRPVLDPAAETEIGLMLQDLGFVLLDPSSATNPVDIELVGEAFSEFGLRTGNLVSCKGHVEVRAIERSSGRILAIDRQTEVAVDVAEGIAGKAAIQKAAAAVGARIIARIVSARGL